jgi:hypothetical protein
MILFQTHPLLSIFFSLLIINGFYNLSRIISENKIFQFFNNYAVQAKIIVFFFIINFFSIFFYIYFLFFGVNKVFLQILVVLLILIGFYKPAHFKSFSKITQLINNKVKFLFLLFIFAYFLLSILPITDPDSLDYHITVPYLSLLSGKFFIEKEWFTSQLAGAGEALITFGLSINSYKLSSILQFVSLYSIVFAIINLNPKKFLLNTESKILISLSILCIPCFLFLTFTAKPQLFSIATNFIAFLMTFFILPYENNKKRATIVFGFTVFLALSSTQFKFSFFLSSTIILVFAFYEMIKKKLFLKSFFIVLFLFIIIILPREYFDYSYLSTDIIKNFFQPITDNYVSEYFVESLRHGSGNSRYYPYWLFLPIDQYGINLSTLTEILGLTILIFLVNFKYRLINKFILASLIFFVIALPLGQPVGRFFIEPFLWLMTGSIYYIGSKNNLIFKTFKKLLIINSIVMIFFIFYTVINFLPGVFSVEKYKNILRKYGEGYLLYEWANKKLPSNSVILTSHRSYIFSDYPFVSYEFRLFVRTQNQLDYFTNLIVKKKPTHLLYNGLDHNLSADALKNCRGKLVYFEKNVATKATRNPLTTNYLYYDAYLYEIDIEKLEKCKKK